MSAKTVRPHLDYILDTLRVIEENTPADHSKFMSDRNAQDATLMRLQDIGEQLARIRDQFPNFFEQHQDESWHKLVGLRNIISHGYREIDFAIIWDVISTKLPEFAEHMREVARA
jgi:uncharacterized protein with HEPN domain